MTPVEQGRARFNAPDIDTHPFGVADRDGQLCAAERYGLVFALTAPKAAGAQALLARHPGGHVIDRRTGESA